MNQDRERGDAPDRISKMVAEFKAIRRYAIAGLEGDDPDCRPQLSAILIAVERAIGPKRAPTVIPPASSEDN